MGKCVSLSENAGRGRGKVKSREILEKKFPEKEVKTRLGREGQEVYYLETASVIRRLNEAWEGDWSFEVKDKGIDREAGCVWVLGRLTCGGVVKEQFGSKIISLSSDGAMVDLGSDLKAATSDALKKCATLLGVGIYLYEEEDEALSRRASQKQKDFLRDLLKEKGKAVDEEMLKTISSEEASRLIDECLKKEESKK